MRRIFNVLCALGFVFGSVLQAQTIYQHNFGTTVIASHPYNVAPGTFDANLSNSSWSNSGGAWTSFAGATGQAIALSNSGGTPVITLTFDVAPGYNCDITSFNFWRQRSNAGAQNWSMNINGTNVGSGTVPTAGTNIGSTTVANAVNGLSGTVSVVLSLSGASGAGTFRLDDFTLDGTVYPIGPVCTPPATQASLFASANITNTTADLSWTAGSSGNVIVVAHQGSAVNADPSNGTTYSANAVFASGTQIGTGNYVVYDGTGTNVTVTGLALGTQYFFAVYEYDPNAGSPCYHLIELTGNITTTGAVASCLEIESLLADACNGSPCPTGATEGENEMVRFKIGSTPLNVADLTVIWPATAAGGSQTPWRGIETSAAITNPIVNALNSTITACGYLKEPIGGVMPAGSTVLMVTSTDMCVLGNSFANLADTLYIIFQEAGNTAGHFTNTGAPAIRTLTMSFSNPASCSDAVSYDRAMLIGNDGASVAYTAAGTASYYNSGCQAPIVPLAIEAGNNVSVCFNGSVSLSATTQNQFTSILWSGGTGTFTPNNSLNTSYTPGAGETSGSVLLYVQLNNNCGGFIKDSLVVTINPSPTPTVTANIGSATVCSSSPITLTASGGTSYVWSTTATTNTVTVNPVSSTVYTVDVSNACSTTQGTFSVTVNDLPLVTASNTGAYCVKDSIRFNSTAGFTYAWTGPNSFSSALQNPFIGNSSLANAGTYSLTVTDNNTCQNSTTTTVVVNALPVINTVAPPITITPANCGSADGSVTGSNASGTAPFLYQWISSSGSVLDIDTALNNVTGGVYFLAATDGNGCRDSVSFVVPTAGGPTIPVFSIIPTVCEGEFFVLGMDASSTTPGATYNWTLGGNLVQTGVDLTSINVLSASTTSAGPYTVEVVAGGCSNSTVVSAILNPSAVPFITGTLEFCAGSSTVLNASSSIPTGNAYQWYLNNSPISGAINTTYTVTQAGDYQLLVTNNGCDSLSVSSIVTVNALPVLNTATPPVTIINAGCGLTDGSITGANASGNQPIVYQWTNGSGSTLSNDTILNGVGAGSFYLVATDNNGCVDSAQFTLSADPAPVSPTFAGASVVCEGSTFSLSVTNPIAGAIYSWAAAGLSTQTAVDLTSITVTDANAINVGTYTVSVTVGACSSNATTGAVFHALPDPQLTALSTSFCAGDSLQLIGTPSLSVTYQWFFNNNPIVGETSADYYADQAGDYQLYVSDGVCDSLSSIFTITENALPVVGVNSIFACISTAANLTATGAQTYIWSAGTTPSSGSDVTVPISATGVSTYTVTGTDNNGCIDTAVASVTVNGNPVIMINAIQNDTITACQNAATTLTASGGNTYVWSTTETTNPISFSSATGAVVSVVGMDLNGCIDSTKIQFVVDQGPAAPTFTGWPNICNGNPAFYKADTISGQTYTWVGSSGTISSQDSVFISAPGTYSLVTTGSCGSTSTPFTVITSNISALFTTDTTIGLAPLTVNFTNTSSNATGYYWDFGNGDTSFLISPSTVYQNAGTYTAYLNVGNNDFCYSGYGVQIIVLETNIYITVPNVFSPNNDGLNDFFGVKSYGIKEFSCEILNRWGTLVTTMNNVNDKWTPAANVSEGTYFFIMKAKGVDGKDYSAQGYVLLAR